MTLIDRALTLWDITEAKVSLVAARENHVYRINHSAGTLALRLHRQNYRTNKQLLAELDWMAWLAQSGLSVPTPQHSREKQYLHSIDDVQVDILTWLPGTTLEDILPAMPITERALLFHRIGSEMAKLHLASASWPEKRQCQRPSWDIDGLVGANPLWDKFWQNPALDKTQKERLIRFRDIAQESLSKLSKTQDYGLIHADLVPSNILIKQNKLHIIDFDDGGFGYYMFDIATALLKHSEANDFSDLQKALIQGYLSQRDMDIAHLDLFMALRAVTYLGWNITRMDEDSTGKRNRRFINQAFKWVSLFS